MTGGLYKGWVTATWDHGRVKARTRRGTTNYLRRPIWTTTLAPVELFSNPLPNSPQRYPIFSATSYL